MWRKILHNFSKVWNSTKKLLPEDTRNYHVCFALCLHFEDIDDAESLLCLQVSCTFFLASITLGRNLRSIQVSLSKRQGHCQQYVLNALMMPKLKLLGLSNDLHIWHEYSRYLVTTRCLATARTNLQWHFTKSARKRRKSVHQSFTVKQLDIKLVCFNWYGQHARL